MKPDPDDLRKLCITGNLTHVYLGAEESMQETWRILLAPPRTPAQQEQDAARPIAVFTTVQLDEDAPRRH